MTVSDGDRPRRRLSITVVCTGNICRSPLAEQLLVARLSEAGLSSAISVQSAGLAAVVGAPMDLIPAEISVRQGGDPSRHGARELTASIVSSSDLLLTMTRAQRDELVHLNPRALRRTFTLTELVKLLALSANSVDKICGGAQFGEIDDSLAERLVQQSQVLSRSRSRITLMPSDEVIDPYCREREVHEVVGQQISMACTQIAHNLVGWAAEAARL
jgi:protein-tyrosine phosphatase